MKMYVLDEQGDPVEIEDLSLWGQWLENAEGRRVARTELPDGTWVSTVFLGLDHSFVDGAEPVLWETMIFGGPLDNYQERYTSRAAAENGHQVAVAKAKAANGATNGQGR